MHAGNNSLDINISGSKSMKSKGSPSVQALKATKSKSAPMSCSLHDLCPEDKQKVAGLLKQILDLGRENKSLKESVDRQGLELDDARVKKQQMEDKAGQMALDNVDLKRKMAQMLKVLKSYQQRVHAMDAAFRSALEDQVVSRMEEEERRKAEEIREAESLALQTSLEPPPVAPEPTAGDREPSFLPALCKACGKSIEARDHASDEASERGEEDGQAAQSSAPVLPFVDSGTQVGPETSVAATSTVREETSSQGCQTMSMFDTVPVQEVANRSEEARLMTPILVAATSASGNPASYSFGAATIADSPMSDNRDRLGAERGLNLAYGLLQWQVDNGLISDVDSQPSTMVLQFDPSFGRFGAFYLESFERTTATEVAAALDWDARSTSQASNMVSATAGSGRPQEIDEEGLKDDDESILSALRDLEEEGLETSMGSSVRFATPKAAMKERYLTLSEDVEESDLDSHLVHFLNSY